MAQRRPHRSIDVFAGATPAGSGPTHNESVVIVYPVVSGLRVRYTRWPSTPIHSSVSSRVFHSRPPSRARSARAACTAAANPRAASLLSASSTGGQVFLEVAGQQTVQMPGGVLALADAMRAIRVVHHGELLVCGHECVDQRFAVLEVHVVIARAVDNEQVAAESTDVRERRGFFVLFGVLVG